MFTYASIRSLYSYIELDIEELNKKEYENIVYINLTFLLGIFFIKVLGYIPDEKTYITFCIF
jgi:hypothetical protein